MEFMYSLILSLLVIPLLSLLFSFLTRGRNSDHDLKLPPSPLKLPIIGNLHQLIGCPLPHYGFHKLAKRYGPIYKLKLGEVGVIVISSPTILKEIVLEHGQNFSNRPVIPSMRDFTYNYKDMAFAPACDPCWRQLRKIATLELLSNKQVKSFQPIREEEVTHLIEEIYDEASQGSIINLTKKIYRTTNQIVCRAALGKARGNERLLKGIRETVELSSGFNLADLFPSLKFLNVLTGVRSKLAKIHHELDGFFNEVLEDHRAKINDRSGGEDLVDVLLRVQKELYDSGEEALTDSSIKAIIIDMFVAGTDTAAATINWAMSRLMKNPRVMKEAQAEVRSALSGKLIVESDINKLNYLKLVIKETFRLHPPAPLLLPREAIDSCTVNGYHIPAKCRIIVNAWAISRDPTYWFDAEEFQPERFQDNEVDFKGQHMEFTPFGSGRRGCPGMNFGVAIVEIVLAQLLVCFNWKMPNGMSVRDLNMDEIFGAVCARKDDLCLVAVPFVSIPN